MPDSLPRHRFLCRVCRAPLTPWQRELTLKGALCTTESGTWLLPRGYLVLRASPHLPQHPWVFAPVASRLIQPHTDLARTIGCCGMSYNPDAPNLLCANGHEVGLGYRDCCGPHWYALHEDAIHETAMDPSPPLDGHDRLVRLRDRIAASLSPALPFTNGNCEAYHDDPTDWDRLPFVSAPSLEIGGGELESAVRIGGLPGGAILQLPIPWPKLVGMFCLGETPWGEGDVPLCWKRQGGPEVNIVRIGERVLCTASFREPDACASVVFSAAAWAQSWRELRER